ncbi:Rieske 2Fe-2S domain-containing protein [Streptomyces sp. NPDC005963]|uniref:Rieske 2Fe-2S domain-containing protein n=1 Tax=Streptomyces sp. NPDC005963 TaxID=3156721 RepID=UPI00340D27B4
MRLRNRTRRFVGKPVRTHDELPVPLPFPDGWFYLGMSHEWKPGSVRTLTFAGEEVVVYRTRKGTLCATRPYCPHMGAHLGVGGSVEDEYLVCPFHRFGFTTDGECARTPYGSPPKARLDTLPVREISSMVWIWRHHNGEPPSWELPAMGIAGGHTPLSHSIELAGQTQDGTENGVDYGHITELHRIGVQSAVAKFVPDSPFFDLNYQLFRDFPLLGTTKQDFQMRAIGIAAYYGEIVLTRYGLRILTWSLCTPTEPGRFRFTMAHASSLDGPRWLPGPLRRLGARAVSRAALWKSVKDTTDDLYIWNHRRFLHHPKLNQEDGPIGPFRLWARQFYPPVATDTDGKTAGDAPATTSKRIPAPPPRNTVPRVTTDT